MLPPPSAGAALTAPTCNDAAHEAPTVVTSLERILRLAAISMPFQCVNPLTATLASIASGFRRVRAYYLHDLETCAAIDSWLELYGGLEQ